MTSRGLTADPQLPSSPVPNGRRTLGRAHALSVVSFAVAAGIEVAQWALPLGRVVSPLDAVLDATGATTAGLLTAHVLRMRDQSRASPARTT